MYVCMYVCMYVMCVMYGMYVVYVMYGNVRMLCVNVMYVRYDMLFVAMY